MHHSAAERALSTVTGRLHDRWSVDRLAQALGLSTRTMYRVLAREFGLSPMSLVRKLRLAQAREALEAPCAKASVTRVALDCGFTHLGRFSSDYRRQFGELPSETLARATRQPEHARRLPAVLALGPSPSLP